MSKYIRKPLLPGWIPIPCKGWPTPPHMQTRDCMTKKELYNFAVSEIGGKSVVISFNKPKLEWLLGVYRIESVSGNPNRFVVLARHRFSGGLVDLNGDDICKIKYA